MSISEQHPTLIVRRQVARCIAARFEYQSETAAILVFGSVATGAADIHSDVDILILCHPNLIAALTRRSLLEALSAGWTINAPTSNEIFAAIDDGGIVDGIPITVHYQTVEWINKVLHAVLESGAITTESLPFRPYTLPALLQRSWLLFDKERHVAQWQARLGRYPPLLKRNLVQYFMPILQEQTEELIMTARREIGPRVFLFHLNRAVDALLGIVYALNEVYDPADRRAEATVWPLLRNVPVDFPARLTAILSGPFDSEGANQAARNLQKLVQEVLVQVERDLEY